MNITVPQIAVGLHTSTHYSLLTGDVHYILQSQPQNILLHLELHIHNERIKACAR